MALPPTITTDRRLTVRGWRVDDAPAALPLYGNTDVTRWLGPAVAQVPDLDAMGGILSAWIDEDGRGDGPAGRWAIERRDDGRVVGGVVLLPPPRGDDVEIGWQLAPAMWGNGYAAESTPAIAGWAFDQGLEEFDAWCGLATPATWSRALLFQGVQDPSRQSR